jgi:3-hydroxyacyl-[acyl-carrier-protein] dehydratase
MNKTAKKQTALIIPVDHPAFAGHFPGMPIVPGVLLLDAAIHTIASDIGQPERTWQINSVKFLSPLKPGEAVMIEHEVQANGSISFEILEQTRLIVSGSLALSP